MSKDNSIKHLSAHALADVIKELQAIHGEIQDLKKRYHFKAQQLHDMKKCHKGIIYECAELESLVNKLQEENSNLKKGITSTEAEYNLGSLISKICAQKVKEYEWEAKLAWDCLEKYHAGVLSSMVIARSDILSGENAASVTFDVQRKLDETAIKISRRIKLDSTMDKALNFAKHLDETSGSTLDEKTDADETMGQGS